MTTRPGNRPVPAVCLIVALLILGIALSLRLPRLALRPLHADEAVHTLKFRDLWEKGDYRYDSNEFHGPTIYYAALPVVLANGRTNFGATRETDFRLPPALCGAGMALLCLLLWDGLGLEAALLAAALFAISPAFVFYSRYYIQETFLAAATLGMLGCLWRASRDPRRALIWMAASGLCAGLMIASKETAVFAFVAALIGALASHPGSRTRHPSLSSRFAEGGDREAVEITGYGFPDPSRRGRGKDALRRPRGGQAPRGGTQTGWALFLLCALVTAALFLTGMGKHPVAVLDYLRSYTPWMHRANGTDLHRHPALYYAQLLIGTRVRGGIYSEGLILLLALIGAVAAFLPAGRRFGLSGGTEPKLARFLVVYTVVLFLLYSAVPYKTPWCILSPLTGLILLAGIGVGALWHFLRGRRVGQGIVVAILLAGMGHLVWQDWAENFVYFANPKMPYVHSPTAPEVVELGKRVEELAALSPQGNRTTVAVVGRDAYIWPLPWYLRRMEQIGFWSGSVPAEIGSAPLIVATSDFDDELGTRLDKTHQMAGFFGLRPGVLMELWVRNDLWTAYLKRKDADHSREPENAMP